MELPSKRMKSLCIRSRAALGFLSVLLTVLLASQAMGVPIMDDDDMIAFLSLSLGGRDVAVAAWSNMNPSEKQTLRDQAARIAKMSEGAELDGLLLSPDVERTLRWGISSFLADAWEKKIASETDLSVAAARSFYEANRQWYIDEGAVRYRKAVYPASQKNVASRVKAQLQKAPLSRLKNCVTVDWTEYESIAEPLGGALRTASIGVIMGPIETIDGHVLYEVLERRREMQIPFEKCAYRVREDMVRAAVMEKLEKLNPQ